MRKFLLFVLALLSTVISLAETTLTPSTPLVVSNNEGLAAFYCGTVGGEVCVAGGANFPDVPCAEGGRKHFYDEIRVLRNGQWQVVGRLPFAVAGGASATTSDGVLCVGGQDSLGLHSEAFIITADYKIRMLPSLPVALKEHALAIGKDKAYVVGGATAESTNNHVYELNLADKKAAWTIIAELPDGERIQPAVTVQTGATSQCLYVFGGYAKTDKGFVARTDGQFLNLMTMLWKPTRSIPDGMTLTGSSVANSGYSHILCIGGVNKDVFEARLNEPNPTSEYFLHQPSWYKFNRSLLVYHTITDSWFTLTESELLARAGAGFVKLPEKKYSLSASKNISQGDIDNLKAGFIIISGETKPGIRSTDVTTLSLTQEHSFGWLNWLVLVIYLLSMLLLGYVFMKRESGADDFFKGGGRIPWWAAGISIYATMLSALTYMSIPAKAYATNWTYYIMLVTILFVSYPVIKYYLPYFRRLKITSAYEYLEMRFNAATRLLASGLFIIFMVARMALVLYLPSLALTAVTGINIQLCIVLMGIVTIMYCTMGGVEAVVWGDVIQGLILVGGAFFLAGWLIFNTEGGAEGYLQIAMDNDKMRLLDWSLDYRSVTFWVAIVGGMANNLISYTSDQTVIQRYLTTKDEKSAANSILMNAIMCICVSIVFYVIGTGLYTFFQTHPAELDLTMDKGDAILPYFMMKEMPQGVAGLLIAAIFAATMSTISSNINSISTAFSVDFWKRFRPQTSDRSMLRVARMTCLTSGVIGVAIALLMASWDILSLLDYFNTILGLLTGGLGGLFLIGIFIPRIGGRAALTGFVAGTAFVFWMQYCTDANLFLYGAAGIAVSVIVAFLCSFIYKEKRRADPLSLQGK